MRGTPFGFSGFHLGLNTIDSPFTLVEGEGREMLNVISTERGAIKKRTGSLLFAPGTASTFPTLAATDTFKRAAEKPLSNAGKWTQLPEFGTTGEINGSEHWQIEGVASSGAYWNVAEQTNPAVSVELQTRPTTAGKATSVFACVQNTGVGLSGYEVLIASTGGIAYNVLLRRHKEGITTILAELPNGPFESGDFLCLSVRGGVVTGWRKTAAGVVSKYVEVKDTTYTKGFGGILSNDTTLRLNNFAVGEFPAFTELEFTSLAPVKTAAGTFLIAASGKELFSINAEGEGIKIGEGFTEGKQWSIIQSYKAKVETGGPVYLTNGTDPPQTWIGAEGKEKVKEWKSKEGEIAEFKEEFVATPKAKFITSHLGRVFAANLGGGTSAEKSWVRWSRLNLKQESDPSLWPKEYYIEFDADDGTEITGLGTVGPYVLVFKPYKCFVIHNFTTNGYRQLSENTGCVSHRSITETPVGTFFLSADQGVYLTNGSRLTEMSYKVRPTFLKINQAEREKSCGAFFNNHYYISIPYETSKTPNRTLDYDVALKSWWIHDIAGNQWAEWEPTSPGEPFLFTAPAKAKGGVVKAFVPGIFTDSGANYTGENGLGAFWISPWETFFYFIFRHRIKAPFIKKRIREFFFDGSGEVVPFFYRSFNANKETLACVVNNNDMNKPELPVKLTSPETGIWAGGEGGWAEAGDNWGGQPVAARARSYALGTFTEISFGFGNNTPEPFEVTMVALMAQFRKS